MRKIWIILDLDLLFANIKKHHNRYQKNKKGEVYPKINYDIDGTVFMLAAERILNPKSKIQSLSNSQNQYFSYNHISKDDLYSALDVLTMNKDKVVKHLNKKADQLLTRKAYVALYDVTTFYFESFDEDDLRRRGMSKDHKTNETQVVLGLLVDADGIPFTYSLYPGNTAEVHALIKIIDDLKKEYNLTDVTVIADTGLNQMRNLSAMDERGIKWIVKYTPYTKLTKKEKDKLLREEGWVETSSDPENIRKYKELKITKTFLDEEKVINIMFLVVASACTVVADFVRIWKKFTKKKTRLEPTCVKDNHRLKPLLVQDLKALSCKRNLRIVRLNTLLTKIRLKIENTGLDTMPSSLISMI